MKLYSVMVRLYEASKGGNPLRVAGPFRDEVRAQAALVEEREEWQGPNVEEVYLETMTVEDDA